MYMSVDGTILEGVDKPSLPTPRGNHHVNIISLRQAPLPILGILGMEILDLVRMLIIPIPMMECIMYY